MVDKYIGTLPPGSIWFHFSQAEMVAFIQSKPDFIPDVEKVALKDLKDGDLHAIDVEKVEAAIVRAGLRITTLY